MVNETESPSTRICRLEVLFFVFSYLVQWQYFREDAFLEYYYDSHYIIDIPKSSNRTSG